jgi:hypothetical protein
MRGLGLAASYRNPETPDAQLPNPALIALWFVTHCR